MYNRDQLHSLQYQYPAMILSIYWDWLTNYSYIRSSARTVLLVLTTTTTHITGTRTCMPYCMVLSSRRLCRALVVLRGPYSQIALLIPSYSTTAISDFLILFPSNQKSFWVQLGLHLPVVHKKDPTATTGKKPFFRFYTGSTVEVYFIFKLCTVVCLLRN